MCKVAMLVTNGYGPDWRVQKEAHTLALAGHRVTVIAWDRTQLYAPHQIEHTPDVLRAALDGWQWAAQQPPEPVAIVRIGVSAGYRTGRPLLRTMPRFWLRALNELRRIQPDIVHAHDLDTVPVAYLYAQRAGIPVIYDAHEYYAGMVRDNLGVGLAALLDRMDGWYSPRVTAMLAMSERLVKRHRDMGAKVWFVSNSQPLVDRAGLVQKGAARRQQWHIPAEALLLVYVGYLNPDRLLSIILEAVPRRENVWLVIGGDGPQRTLVEAAAAGCPRIKYVGWVPQQEVAEMVAAGDVVYYGLNAAVENVNYSLSNLALFALSTGRPILTTPVGEVAEVVEREDCGVVMATSTTDAAEQALGQLEDAPRRARWTEHASYLGETKYHWRMAADQLMDAYASAIEKKRVQF